jgi:hypothetical protein
VIQSCNLLNHSKICDLQQSMAASLPITQPDLAMQIEDQVAFRMVQVNVIL